MSVYATAYSDTSNGQTSHPLLSSITHHQKTQALSTLSDMMLTTSNAFASESAYAAATAACITIKGRQGLYIDHYRRKIKISSERKNDSSGKDVTYQTSSRHV